MCRRTCKRIEMKLSLTSQMVLTADGRDALAACVRHQTGGDTTSEMQPAGSNTDGAAD
jgi:hypothetical protein